jgi:hypothetical protein
MNYQNSALAIPRRSLAEGLAEKSRHMLDGLESGLGCNLFDGESSIEYQSPRLLELNLADCGTNSTTGCRFEVGLETGSRNRYKVNNIPLDTLDRERSEIVRRREGLQILVERLAARQAPLQAKARQLAQIADQQRQDDEVEKFQRAAEKLSRQVIEHWRRACSEAFELTALIDEAIAGRGIDADHRSQVLSTNERLNRLFLAEGLKPVNEAWPRRESHLFRRMAVVVARPK